MSAERISIGCGSASSLDPVDMAEELAASGLIEAICFDCLSERTLTLAQLRKLEDPSTGHDVRLPDIVQRLAPFVRDGGRIIGNFGAANTDSAMGIVVQGLRAQGLAGKRVGVIRGDDVRDLVLHANPRLAELGCHVVDVKDQVLCANAYIGAAPVAELLDKAADVVIGGRLADPSMYVGAICHELGWDLSDWDDVASATLAGHLLETGTYTTGGVFADPPYRVCPDADRLGMPYAVIDGDAVLVSKAAGTGGMVTTETVKAMLGYEIHDPGAYLTPDVAADFLDVHVEQVEPDVVRVTGAAGRPAPETLKVLVGIDRGWRGVGEISFGGPGCLARGQESIEIMKRRTARYADAIEDIRYDLIGHSSLLGGQYEQGAPTEVRLRVSARSLDRRAAERVAGEVEHLLLVGPAGGGGGTTLVTRALGVTPCYVDRRDVDLQVEVMVA